jgi:hypothetical protein
MSTGEDGDEGILKLFYRRMTDGLLLDLNVPCNSVKELERTKLDADSAERRARRIDFRVSYRSLVFHAADTPQSLISVKQLRGITVFQAASYQSTYALFWAKLRNIRFVIGLGESVNSRYRILLRMFPHFSSHQERLNGIAGRQFD